MEFMGTLISFGLIFLVFYLFIIRPQSKQQKQVQKMRENIKVGDEVLTIGGFYGIVYAIDEKNIVLELLPDFNKAMVVKTAISKVITGEESVLEDEEDITDETPNEENIVEDENLSEASENTEEKENETHKDS